MTVDDLIERLQQVTNNGFGTSEVQTFDPDSEAWQPVTGLTYGDETETVKLYTDEP